MIEELGQLDGCTRYEAFTQVVAERSQGAILDGVAKTLLRAQRQSRALMAKTKAPGHGDLMKIPLEVPLYRQESRVLTHSVVHAKGITTVEELHRKYWDCAKALLPPESIE